MFISKAGAESVRSKKISVAALTRLHHRLDESGLRDRPHRCRTWPPKGQTPMLLYHFSRKTLSARAGATWWIRCPFGEVWTHLLPCLCEEASLTREIGEPHSRILSTTEARHLVAVGEIDKPNNTRLTFRLLR